MVSIVKQDEDSKKGETVDQNILHIYTQSPQNKIPFQVNKIDNIKLIGSLTDVEPDGNCYFTSLWNAMHHLDVVK